jgi:hypothetical protein
MEVAAPEGENREGQEPEEQQLDSGTDDSTLQFDFTKRGKMSREVLNEKEKDR